MTQPTHERIDGPTPNGGDYAEIFYQDADGQPCPKDKAVKAEGVEYKEGKEISRTYLASE